MDEEKNQTSKTETIVRNIDQDGKLINEVHTTVTVFEPEKSNLPTGMYL